MKKLVALILMCAVTFGSLTILNKQVTVLARVTAGDPVNFNGDLIVNGTEPLTYNNATIIVNGSVIIENGGALILRNSNLTILTTVNNVTVSRNFTMRNPFNGMPKLIVEDSDIDSNGAAVLMYMDDASISLNGLITRSNMIVTRSYLNVSSASEISGRTGVWAYDSVIRLTNTTGGTNLPLLLSNSTLIASNGGMSTVSLQNRSNVTMTDSSLVSSTIVLTDNTALTATTSVISKFIATNAFLQITNCTIVSGNAAGTTQMTINGCVPPYQIQSLQMNGSSTAQITNSRITNLGVYDNSNVTIDGIESIGAISSVIVSQNGEATISKGKIDNLFALGNSRGAFSGIEFLQVSIAQKANVALSGVIVQQWAYLIDEASASIENSILRGAFDQEQTSQLSILNTTIAIFSIHNTAFAYLSNTTATEIRALDGSIIDVIGSKITGLEIHSSSVTGTINGIASNQLQYWNLQKNNSLSFTSSDGYLANVTLIQMEKPQHMSLFFGGTSNVTLNNAELGTLVLYDNTFAKAYNSSIGSLQARGQSWLYSYWRITIQVTDDQNNPVSGANVGIYEPGTGVLTQGTTDSNGKFAYDNEVLASVVNGTGVVHSLIFEASKGDSFKRAEAVDFASGNVHLSLPIPTPWYVQYWYLLVLIIALAAGIVAIRFRFRG